VFKRIVWMGTGMAVGAGGAFWAKHKVEATVARYVPEQVADRAAAQARGMGRTVRAAATEGREAMRQREAELRRQVEARTFVGVRGPEPEPTPAVADPAPGARRTSRTPSGDVGRSRRRRRTRR
jgi:hypothetical protein